MLASWFVGDLVVGELDCWRVVQLPCIPPGEVTQIKLLGQQLDKICIENDEVLVGMDASVRNFLVGSRIGLLRPPDFFNRLTVRKKTR